MKIRSPRRTAAALTEVELLATENQRRVTPDYNDQEAAGDPMIERYARQRKESQASKVLDLLDELERSRK
jgi:hypothetical protein